MSLCQSLRQYVFVHRAVIEGVLMLVDEERRLYGRSWKDSDFEELSKLVSARFPDAPATTSESGISMGSAADTSGSGPTSSVASGSGNNGSEESKSGNLAPSQIKGKRRASPTELPKEDKRGNARTSKRPIIKRPLQSCDENLHDATAGRVEEVALTPLAMRCTCGVRVVLCVVPARRGRARVYERLFGLQG
jgi:tyrosine-protein phosphatase 2/3